MSEKSPVATYAPTPAPVTASVAKPAAAAPGTVPVAPPRKRLVQVRAPLGPRASFFFGLGAFILPLLVWSAFSYLPFIWHPKVLIHDPGDVSYFTVDMLVDKPMFDEENAKLKETGGKPATGLRANPVYLPPPHKVAKAFVTAFLTPPQLAGDPWLHESLAHSIRVILLGFGLSALIGLPLGILAGSFAPLSRLTEPFIDFIRYMPAPAFGALAVAILGITDAPKVAIIFIGTFFQMVLVIANTARGLPFTLLEAAQTLGARPKQLILRVVVPGILPQLYRDMRILLGWAWTYLIVAELIGASSGISFFINQQAKYRNYENVYAAIIMIGLIGLGTDLVLKAVGKRMFPWEANKK
jgi:NitT/TauT family transport system permease protein